jgi:rhodanese-related sulfurtransferase
MRMSARWKRWSAVSVCLVCGCAGQGSAVRQIGSAQDLKARMDGGQIVVIHALDRAHYEKGHIPGAVNVDYERMQPEMLPAGKDQALVFYCAGGMCPVGRMAANKAAGWGYSNVWVYEGGIKDWEKSGMTVARGGP